MRLASWRRWQRRSRVDSAAPQVSVEAALELALALQRKGRLDDAAALYEGVLRLAPQDFNALHMLGVVRHRQRKYDQAIELIGRALAAQPSAGIALNNLGNALRASGRFDEAVARYNAALRLMPQRERAAVLVNRGLALSGMGREREAVADYREAQSLDPDNADARFADALMLLSQGDFDAGWPLYEWRWRRPGGPDAPFGGFAGTAWTGAEPLQGRRIRVAHEQGYGDSLMAARYVPMLAARGAKVELAVPAPLEALMRSSFPDAELVGDGAGRPCDLFCPAMSLPRSFGTTMRSIPASVPYLKPSDERIAKWRAWLGAAEGMRVGLAWSGNPRHENDQVRSLPACPLPGLQVDGVRWFSLQRDLAAADAAVLARYGASNAAAACVDFADVAAVVAQLDLVITVDSAVAHLAGAVGKPVWIMLPQLAEWRWQAGRKDCPWYPSATIFRQPVFGAWAAVMDEVRAALHEVAKGLRKP